MILLVSGALFFAPANAYVIPIFDGTRFGAFLQEYGTKIGRWGTQVSKWQEEIKRFQDNYNSLLSQVKGLQEINEVFSGASLEKVNPLHGVEERCGSPYGKGFGGVLGRLTGIDLRGDVYEKQYEYCRHIQQMRNQQYNEMVEFMANNFEVMKSAYKEVAEEALSSSSSQGKTSGDMSAALAKVTAANAQVEFNRRSFKARMSGYDALIGSLESHRMLLTRNALRGEQGLLKRTVTTAIMAQQLCGGGKC